MEFDKLSNRVIECALEETFEKCFRQGTLAEAKGGVVQRSHKLIGFTQNSRVVHTLHERTGVIIKNRNWGD